MGSYSEVENNLPLCRLQSRLQHIYHGQPYARVDFIPQSGTQDVASVCDVFFLREGGRPGDGSFIQLGWRNDCVFICYEKLVILYCSVFTHRVKAVHGLRRARL